MTLELISFKICPFVQRSVIILLEKQIEFDITYIDIKSPPEWFLKISPFGKVPVLRAEGTVLFESAVINEYLDETHPPSLHPADPLRRAHNRAWIEFGSVLNFAQHDLLFAKDKSSYDTLYEKIRGNLRLLESQLGEGPFFNGDRFALVDAAYAPPLMRFNLIEQYHAFGVLEGCDKLRAWSDILLERDSVKRSVVEDFPQRYVKAVTSGEGYAAQFFH